MNDLYKALGDIGNIRRQMASSTQFRGYGPATLSATAAFAIIAGCIQKLLIPDSATNISAYMTIWIATAVVSAILIGTQMYLRTRRLHSPISNEMLRMAVQQFLPVLATGALVTVVILRYTPSSAWLLPGLWQILGSLGIFSSCRFLPRSVAAAGVWYLLTGLTCIALNGPQAFSPLAMAIPFAVGQLLVAAVLLLHSSEANDEA